MSRHYTALFQSWKTVNLYRSFIQSSPNIRNYNFHRRFISVSLQKHKGNMRLLAKGFPPMYSTSSSTLESEKSEEVPFSDMLVTKYKVGKLIRKLKLEKEGRKEKALKLLKICKDTDRLSVELKKDFVKEIWTLLADSKEATEDHCKEYLLCNLKYRSVVSPQLFLSDLIKCNIFINHGILLLLLQNACNHGLLSDINFILLTMEEMGFPMSEEVQMMLMLGKAKAGEMNEVLKIFKELESLEGIANHETYTALLKAIACTGDQKLLNDYYNQALECEIKFTEEEVLSILETLIYNNHFDLLPEVLDWKPNFDGKNLKKFFLNLTSHNYCEVAVALLPTITEMKEDEEFVRIFLNRIIQANIPFDDVFSVCKLFTDKNVSNYALLSATHYYLFNRNVDGSLKMFQILLDNGFPVRVHYFWPLIIHSSKTDGSSGVFKILKEMRKFKMEFDSTTLINYIMPQIKNLEPEIIVTKIKDLTGWGYTEVFEDLVLCFLRETRFADVYKMIAECKRRTCKEITVPQLAKHLASKVQKNNIHLAVEIMTLLPPTFVAEFVKNFSRSVNDIPLFVSVIEVLNNRNFSISRQDYHFIIDSILKKRSDIAPYALDEVVPKLLNLVKSNDSETTPKITSLPDAVYLQGKVGRSRSIEYFENLLSEKESKNEDPSFVLCNLLSIYVQSKNYEKATEIKKKAEGLSVKLTPGLKSKLLELSIEKKDLQTSISHYKELLTEHPNFEIDVYKIILLASLLVENGLADQALEVLEVSLKNKDNNPFYHHNRLMELLENVAKCENIDLYEKFLHVSLRKKISNMDAKLFYPLMKWYLKKGKINEACKLFSYCVEKHKIAPIPMQLITRVLEECEIDELWKILRMYGTVCGKLEVRTVTSFAYARTGRVVELKNYLQENPFSFFENNSYAKKIIDFSVRSGRSTELETLFFSLYPSQEAEEFIPYIFKSYSFNEDRDRPLKFLEQITEQNIQFPTKYGQYVASAINLKKQR